jgi:uncharacterized protein (TIGR00290 family)
MTRPQAAVSWSGGKDSCLALMRLARQLDVRWAITMFDEAGARSRSHGLRPEVVAAQVRRLGLEPVARSCTWPTYEAAFADALREVAAAGCEVVVFGDIFEDSHRAWTDRLATAAGLRAMQPLWGEDTGAVVADFLTRGGDARLVTVRDAYLDASWLGRRLSRATIDEMTALGVDPCGERGEYHTAVVDCPLFSSPLTVSLGERVARDGCHAVDLVVDDAMEVRADGRRDRG